MEESFLDSHMEEFILYSEGQGGITLQVPSRDVWNLCLHNQPHESIEEAFEHSRRMDAKFHDKITALLRRYSGNLIPFYEWERNRSVKPRNYTKKVEEKTMSNNSSEGVFTGAVKDAVKKGAQSAVVDQASDILLDAFKGMFEGNDAIEAALENEMGRETAKLVTALAIFYVQNSYPGMIPQGDHVANICKQIVENSTRNIIAPNLAVLTQQLGQLSKLGNAVPNFDEAMLLDTAEEEANFKAEERAEVPATVGRFRDNK